MSLKLVAHQYLILALIACACVLASPVLAVEKGERFKDWTVDCGKLPGVEQDRCFIIQTVINKENEQPVLQMAVGYLPDENGANQPAALLTLPLGVALPAGIGIRVDSSKPIRIPYERCVPIGCIAGFPLDENLIGQFKRGSKAEIRIHDGSRVVALPISLSGFTAGFNALK